MTSQTTVEEPAASSEISIAIDTVKHEVAAFDKIAAGLAALRKDYPIDVIVDVATTAGMKSAIVARAAYRDPRVELEKARKSAKAPVLELGKNIDKLAGDISKQLLIGEDWYDKQIKAQEALRAAQKAEAEAKEAERIKAIQARIALNFSTRAMRAAHSDVEALKAIFIETENAPVTEDLYAEFTDMAVEAKEEAVTAIRTLLLTVIAAQAEAERQKQIAAENARRAEELRKQQEDFIAEQKLHREEIERGARELAAQQEAARKARQDELDKIAAAQKLLDDAKREERDRLAAIERKRLDDEAAAVRAEENRLAAASRLAFEETQRVAAAENAARAEEAAKKAAAELAKQRRATAKLAQVQKCAPRLLSILQRVRYACEHKSSDIDLVGAMSILLPEIKTAIAEAEEGEPS